MCQIVFVGRQTGTKQWPHSGYTLLHRAEASICPWDTELEKGTTCTRNINKTNIPVFNGMHQSMRRVLISFITANIL